MINSEKITKNNPNIIEKYKILDKRGNIIFRNFELGDEQGLAEVFNLAFQQNGVGALKTAKNFHWRYIKYPDFKKEQINLAQNTETSKIIGSVMGNITKYYFNGIPYRIGVINDVATIPGYGGKGIGHNLVKMALNHFIDEDADFAALSADANGFPRSKIYLKYGFQDFIRFKIIVYMTDFLTILKNIGILTPALPALSIQRVNYYLQKIKNYRLNNNKDSKRDLRFQFENLHYQTTEEFRQAMNESGKKNLFGYHIYTKEEWKWCNKNTPSKLYQASQIAIRNNITNEIVGGALIMKNNFYASKFGLKFPMGVIKNIFIDEIKIKKIYSSIGNVRKNKKKVLSCILRDAYFQLYTGIISEALHRRCAVTLIAVPENNINVINCAKLYGFLVVPGGVHMVKPIKKSLDAIKLNKKPFYLDPGEDFGSM